MSEHAQLESIADNIWLVEGPVVDFYGFAYPTRSVIVRLPGGDLWVWSPVALTPELKAQVDALGRPAHLVSPNKIHHLFLGEWKAAWPDAEMWGPKSIIRKRKDLSFHGALEEKPPEAWETAIDMAHVAGSFFMDEVVFFHKASRTAIFADLTENFSEGFLKEHWSWWQRPIARIWKIVEGFGYAPLEWRMSFFDRRKARAAKKKILGWDPERVIMAHGEWVCSGGRAYLENALAWL